MNLLGGALDAIEWSVQRHEEKSEGLIFHPGYKRLQRSTGNLDQLKKLTIHPKRPNICALKSCTSTEIGNRYANLAKQEPGRGRQNR